MDATFDLQGHWNQPAMSQEEREAMWDKMAEDELEADDAKREAAKKRLFRKSVPEAYSVMVHSNQYPERGDILRFKSAQGIMTATIEEVKPCYNPDDMFTLVVGNLAKEAA